MELQNGAIISSLNSKSGSFEIVKYNLDKKGSFHKIVQYLNLNVLTLDDIILKKYFKQYSSYVP